MFGSAPTLVVPADALSSRCYVALTLSPLTRIVFVMRFLIVQELCESRGGHPGLSVLTSLLVSVDVKLY